MLKRHFHGWQSTVSVATADDPKHYRRISYGSILNILGLAVLVETVL